MRAQPAYEREPSRADAAKLQSFGRGQSGSCEPFLTEIPQARAQKNRVRSDHDQARRAGVQRVREWQIRPAAPGCLSFQQADPWWRAYASGPEPAGIRAEGRTDLLMSKKLTSEHWAKRRVCV